MTKYRLAIDLGSTSIGWGILALDENNKPQSIIDMGVRIFTDGRDSKSKEPLSVSRRNARSMRRTMERKKARQRRLMSLMIQNGLMPQDETIRKNLECLDPYELRTKAIEEKIPLHHLGRALFHINERRGFKSNRKTDRQEKNDSNMKNAIHHLNTKIQASGMRTLGEYLYNEKKEHRPARVRTTQAVNNKLEYNFYPARELYENEIEIILETQKKYHIELTEILCEQIKDIIFYQRKLKPPFIGYCRFETNEKRIRKAHPLFQKYRILQEVNNLELENFGENDYRLSTEDKQKIIDVLLKKKKIKFSQLRTLLKIGRNYKFNLESDARSELRGDDTAAILGSDQCFGKSWVQINTIQQENIVERLFADENENELIEWLMSEWNLDISEAEATASARLENGYGTLSKKAIEKILVGLEKGLKYDKAVKEVYPHHSDFRTGEIYDHLPYYGEILPNSVIGGTFMEEHRLIPEKYYGKINNPTVHIVLNQVRKLGNKLFEKYGHPEEIVVELARDLKEPNKIIKKEQEKNTKKNEYINDELNKIGITPNYRNRMLFKLWEDLSDDPKLRCCPFCTDEHPISIAELFNGNYEEEHILPFSRSYNDGRANKFVAHWHCNREKGNKNPFEAFSGDSKRWEAIIQRAQNLPDNKRWRFKEDAWEISKGKDEDIIARMLNDTRYMSKIARQYLAAVFDNEKGKNKVYAITGQMTALMRDKWGLNKILSEFWHRTLKTLFPNKLGVLIDYYQKDDTQKNRAHHLHHAIDAIVIGCTDRGMLQKVSEAANRLEMNEVLQEKRRALVDKMPVPFEKFQQQIANKLNNVVISYKPDHGGAKKAIHALPPFTVAPLHNQTAYGYVREKNKKFIIVTKREPICDLNKKQIGEIADANIREEILNRTKSINKVTKENRPQWKKILNDYSNETGIRHVRIYIKKSKQTMISVRQPNDKGPLKSRGKEYKYYESGGNYCAEIWCTTKGKNAGIWQCEVISNYHAHQKSFKQKWKLENPTARLIMRLHIDDMVAYEEDGIIKICRVKKIDMPTQRVYLRSHQIAFEKKPDELSWAASANLLQRKNARKISVDIIGIIKDPVYMKKRMQEKQLVT